MNRLRLVAFAGIAALALILAACTQTDPTPPASQADVESATNALIDDLGAIAATLQTDPSFGAVAALPPGSPLTPGAPPAPGLAGLLSPLFHADADLPRGTYTHDPATGDWVPSTNAEGNLVLRWTFTDDGGVEHAAELTVDWDVVGATEVVSDSFGTVEVPTDMSASLTVDGEGVAGLELEAAWYDAVLCGGPILEPTSLSVDFFVGEPGTRLEVAFDLAIVDAASGDDTVSTSGSVGATADGDSATFSWELTTAGTLTRSVETCAVEDFTVTSGSVALGVAATEGGVSSSFDIAFSFDNIVIDAFGEVTSVDLSAGSVEIDGEVVMTFSGTFDDADGDGYAGENVTLVFADGTTTDLETFIRRLEMAMAVRRVAALLGR